MVEQKARSFVGVAPSGEPEAVSGNTIVEDLPQADPNISAPPPSKRLKLSSDQVVGPIQRTTVTTEKSQVIPAPTFFDQPPAPSTPTVNGLVTTPAPQNVARGNLHYVPAQNEHDEPQWPNMFRPYAEHMNRKLVDDIYRFNKYDFYQLSCHQSLPAGAPAFSGELPQGPYDDVVEYLKSYAIQNGFPDSAFRIGVVLMPSNRLVTSHILKFGNAKNILKGIEQDQDPELLEKERELKKVKIDAQINAEVKRNNPTPPPAEDPMKLVISMQKQQSEQTNSLVAALAPVLAALVSKPAAAPANNDSLAMIAKMQADSTAMMMKMMMDSQQTTTNLFVKMMEMNGNKKSDAMGMPELFKMMREMKEDIREDFQAALPRDDDDVEVDPKNISGSLLAYGIKGLIHLFKTGGPAVAAAVAQIAASAGKNPNELTDADEPAIRAALNIPPAPKQLTTAAAPKPAAPKPPAPRRLINMPPPKTLEQLKQPVPLPELDDGDKVMEEQRVPDSAVAWLPRPPVPEPPAPAAPVAAEETPATSEIMRHDLEGELLLSLDTMIADIRSGRIERGAPTWVEEACTRWHKEFLDKLCAIEAPVERMKAVMQIVGAKAWSPVDVALADASVSSSGCHYQFFMSFDTLKEVWLASKESTPIEGENNDVAQ